MGILKANPKPGPEVSFFCHLMDFERGQINEEQLKLSTERAIKLYPHLSELIKASSLNREPILNQDRELLSSTDRSQLRLKLMHLLGFNPQEADNLFMSEGLFQTNGHKKLQTIKTIDLAIKVGAFLETSYSILQRDELFVSRNEKPWFFQLRKEYEIHDLINLFKLPDKPTSRSFECARSRILNSNGPTIGTTRLHLPGMLEITIWTDQYFTSDWENILYIMGVASGFNIGDQYAIYVQSSPILTSGYGCIHRMVWIESPCMDNMLKLYRRMFTRRTEEITIYNPWKFEEYKTVRYPFSQREKVVELLDSIGLTPSGRIRYSYPRIRRTSL